KLYWIFDAKAMTAPPSDIFSYRLDSVLVASMALLAVIALVDSILKWRSMYVSGSLLNCAGAELAAVENEMDANQDS
ncbi:MAG: hypothetical protein AAB356_00375, partial [Deltaproteobacteria bacterium]